MGSPVDPVARLWRLTGMSTQDRREKRLEQALRANLRRRKAAGVADAAPGTPPCRRIDLARVPEQTGTNYPAPFDGPVRARRFKRLGEAAGLTQFGVNLVTLPPGCWSSQRHWHAVEDEFVWVVSGELVLVTDAGETVMSPGDCAGFKGGDRDGHHLQNRAEADASFLVVGGRGDADWGEYSDIDMAFRPGRYSGAGGYVRKDGAPY
jgi:uncharacterized cupin superfamily protein